MKKLLFLFTFLKKLLFFKKVINQKIIKKITVTETKRDILNGFLTVDNL